MHDRQGWLREPSAIVTRSWALRRAQQAKQGGIANFMCTQKQINLAAMPKRLGALRVLAPRLLTLSAIACAAALAGCASRSTPQEVQAEPIEAPHIHRPDRALLKPQPAPDCEFRGANVKTMDPDVFARLKLDYERQCYQRAEKIARDRLRVLQASSRCEVEPARYSPAMLR
jgi:hypothetical protein